MMRQDTKSGGKIISEEHRTSELSSMQQLDRQPIFSTSLVQERVR
jgi:hypothetical protein